MLLCVVTEYILPGVVVNTLTFCCYEVGRSGVRIPSVDLFLVFGQDLSIWTELKCLGTQVLRDLSRMGNGT
jgi:hypothetical protein